MITVHRIEEGGLPEERAVQQIETAPTAHMILTDLQNRFVIVPHRDPDFLLQYLFDEETGHLEPNSPDRVSLPQGTGPRHICFHPDGHRIYISNELSGSVTACDYSSTAGTITPVQTLSTLPVDYSGSNKCSQIHITPNARFLYVSNRGHDSIAGFAVDSESGRLSSLGTIQTEPIPRVFHISTSGRHLFVAGRDSGRVVSYRIDEDAGVLTEIASSETGQRAMWIMPVDLPR
jgi:6-phosphogluconolactonase